MAINGLLLCCFFSSVLRFTSTCGAVEEKRKVHIVYLGSLSGGNYSPSFHHMSLLQSAVDDIDGFYENHFVRSYKRSFNGFAAKLTDREAERLAGMEGVVSVFPSKTYQLQTTRSWDFMGFPETVTRKPTAESDIIVGLIDSGIWPESASFSDEGFGPPPTKWKGACKGGTRFTCNNKLIGARYYSAFQDARDDQGHGTHTASTAAGSIVKGASFFGLAEGNARGGVPSARIAMYKVCGKDGCTAEDILAAFDDAIADGVDVLSVSLGASTADEFSKDPVAIGAFHAIKKGILTSHSAGNSGPGLGTSASVAPWLLSVAASSSDRKIIDKVILGNGKTLFGRSVNSFTLNGTKFPIVYGEKASSSCTDVTAETCTSGCLDSNLVEGKIVLCRSSSGNVEAHSAGALGAISLSPLPDVSFVVPLPAPGLISNDFSLVESYVQSTTAPTGNILKSEIIKDSEAPTIVSFSSRGPNFIATEVLKPDVTGPGVDILAAWPDDIPPTASPSDTRQAKFSILSGTSMSCPHVSGVAAYIKTFHPDWSPSAIKSAIMTTAWVMNATTASEAEFAYGSGHVNPVNATDPGLVYETSETDYVSFLCRIGYDSRQVKLITGDDSTCPAVAQNSSILDLNYPSLSAKVSASEAFTVVFNRTVTNVGPATSSYTAKISPHPELDIQVAPQDLAFTSLNEKKSFTVTVSGKGFPGKTIASASIVWSDDTHNVRSPIVLHTIEVGDELPPK